MVWRKKLPMVDVAGVMAYQRAADQKTDADELRQRILDEITVSGVHRWHASTVDQVRLALATVAVVCDRTAELLLDEGTDHGRTTKAPPDVVAFATGLSSNAARQHRMAQTLARRPGSGEVVFDDALRCVLVPEAQVPLWPGYTAAENESGAWEHPDTSAVSYAFIRGIIRAAREVVADTAHAVRALPDPPTEYATLPDLLLSYVMVASSFVESAVLLARFDVKGAEPYVSAHTAFTDAMLAAVALCVPQVLGDDFAPSSR